MDALAGEAFGTVDPRTGITWIALPDRRPPALAEPEVRSLTVAERALVLRPDLVLLWVISAEAYLAGGHYGLAADRYRHAVRLDPTDQQSHVRLAEALVNAGRAGEAIEVYRATLRAFPRLLFTTASPFAAADTDVRVAAARAALLLAHDTGRATARPGAAERRALRRDALRWLREWLTKSPPTGLDLFLVKRDPAFRPVRDAPAREHLPPGERAEWRDLWEAVHSARGTGRQRYAFVGDPAEPSPPDPAKSLRREMKP